jgi:hypothetical protein
VEEPKARASSKERSESKRSDKSPEKRKSSRRSSRESHNRSSSRKKKKETSSEKEPEVVSVPKIELAKIQPPSKVEPAKHPVTGLPSYRKIIEDQNSQIKNASIRQTLAPITKKASLDFS